MHRGFGLLAAVLASGCNAILGVEPGIPADASTTTSSAGTGGGPAAPLALDPGFPVTASVDSTSGATLTTPPLPTAGPSHLVAVTVWAADHTSNAPVVVSGDSLVWTKRFEETFPAGESDGVQPETAGVSIWTTESPSTIAGETVTVTRNPINMAAITLAVYSFAGQAASIGSSNGFGHDDGTSRSLSATVDAQAGSWILGGFLGGVAGAVQPPQPNTVWDVTNNPANAPYGHFTAVGRLAGATTAAGSVAIGATYAGDYCIAAAMEIRAAPGP
jgi:hypothetical protein